ncbi:MAG: signal recognition particle receptor subunit alpha, partial [Candidatus Tectomicrobia bacterium]|nr:signal recognition particle receptor subunit alpha [Candidatus Tectomicrobia bacterium]
MFETLANRLETIFKKLRGRGKLNEANIQEALREVRLALLEADVHFKVVKNFIDQVREKAIGQEVLQSLTPGQQVVKIVHEELLSLMGRTQSKLTLASQPPTIMMLVGLQGSGKTTLSAKLAKRLKKEGHRPFLIPADIRRPAAIDQLETLGKQIDVPVFEAHGAHDVIKICREAIVEGERKGYDILIIDTAGRLHIDQELMEELKAMKKEILPHEILFVADAMTGQNAVNIATAFHEALDID